jgi:hypothetical protein
MTPLERLKSGEKLRRPDWESGRYEKQGGGWPFGVIWPYEYWAKLEEPGWEIHTREGG